MNDTNLVLTKSKEETKADLEAEFEELKSKLREMHNRMWTIDQELLVFKLDEICRDARWIQNNGFEKDEGTCWRNQTYSVVFVEPNFWSFQNEDTMVSADANTLLDAIVSYKENLEARFKEEMEFVNNMLANKEKV